VTAQFVPAPIPWILRIEYVLPVRDRGYDGWEATNFPVIGWEYSPTDYDVPPSTAPVEAELEAWISYKGTPTPMVVVLKALQAEALTRAHRQGLSDSGSINYTLVPA
jgi:hypothetical protein